MMCAASLSGNNLNVTLIEKNEKFGKKLYITGKGRCNLTNSADRSEFMDSIVTNSKFMYSSFGKFSNFDVMDFFEDAGVPLKVERGGRVFPVSDKASDVIKALSYAVKRSGTDVVFGEEVKEILTKSYQEDEKTAKKVVGVKLSNGKIIDCDAVVVATGGLSYPVTGSTGDGYRFAREEGIEVTKCYPSLVAFKVKENFCADMAGLSLKNVGICLVRDGKELYSDFGEMLFTHTGVSGPMILSASARTGIKAEGATLSLDLKPALNEEKLEERLLRDFTAEKNKELKTVLRGLLPASMVPVFVKKLEKKTGKIGEKKVNSVTREERQEIIYLLKNFDMTVTGLCGYNEAIITKGGVNVKEVNPKTMEAKKVKNLYFVGEVLDVDAVTGGYNLQVAWSTAYAAASSLKEKADN